MAYSRYDFMKARADPDTPESCPRFERGEDLRVAPFRCRDDQTRGVRRVMKRSQHPGDISNRRALDAPFRQRTGGITLEVDDDVVLTGIENLPEMKIAMDARPLRRRSCANRIVRNRFRISGCPVDNLQRVVQHRRPARCPVSYAADRKICPGVIAHRLIQRPLIQHGERFRRKIRVFVSDASATCSSAVLRPSILTLSK